MHRGPDPIHLAIDKMSHSRKADLPAKRHKEDLPIDKEYINGNADLLLELYQLPRNLHQALWLAMTRFPYSAPLETRNRRSPDLLSNLSIFHCDCAAPDASGPEDRFEVGIGWIA